MKPTVARKGGPHDGRIDRRTSFAKTGFEPATLVDLLRWRASHESGRQAYTFLEDGEAEESSVNYGELDRQARNVAARLQILGVETGERVLLFYPPGREYVATFLGCLYAGVVAVPAYPPRLSRPISRLQTMMVDSKATVALTTTHILSNLERRFAHAPEMKSLRWLATDDGKILADAWRCPKISSNTLAFLQYTSGSTAAPKGVMVTHGNLLHNLSAIYRRLEHTPDTRMVIWLPPYHDMGLVGGILHPLYGGLPVALMSPMSFLQRPIKWLQAISRLGANTSGGPNFAYDLCSHKITPEERATLDLSNWDVAFTGAEPVRHKTLERFAATFAPCGFRREAFYPSYGLAEATLFASGGAKTAPPVVLPVEGAELERDRVVAASAGDKGARTLVGCGQALGDQKAVVADPESMTQCPPDRVGEIWVSSPSVAKGYWGRTEETERAFGARLADTGEGPFLRTGDLGFLHDGELFVTGRLKDLVIIRGRNHYPQDIEQTVEQSHVALLSGGCAAFSVETGEGERLVVVQELERRYMRSADLGEVVSAIRGAVAENHELQAHAVVLIRTGSIPKTSSGKIQRRATREAYSNDTLTVVAKDMLPGAVEEDTGEAEPVESDAPAADLGESLGWLLPDQSMNEADRILSIVRDFVRRRGRPEPAQFGDSLQGDLGLDSLAVAEMLMEVEIAFEVRLGDSVIAELGTVEDVCGVVSKAARAGTEDTSVSGGIAGLQERMVSQIPQIGAVVSEQDGRNVKIDGLWRSDFASANYLGLDLHPKVQAAAADEIKRWGVHPSWTRAVASPQTFENLEQELAEFIGAKHVLVFPTVTLLHMGVLPMLAGGNGVILLDRAAHNSTKEAAQLAGARGTTIDWFFHNDPKDLERKLEFYRDRPRKIIAINGVYSMSGAYPKLPELVRLARKHDARVYIDDAHGIGVLGENPTPENPYGERGNGIVRYFGLRHGEDIVYVGGMSKAFSSMAAFVTCANEAEKGRLSMASTAVFSGPSPTASVASLRAGLRISRSDEGSAIRRRILRLTRQLVEGVRALGFAVDNNELFPLVSVTVGNVTEVVKACNILWEYGILITPALFPAVPIDRGGLRFTVTAANTEEQVRSAIEALRKVREELYPSEEHPPPGVSSPAENAPG